MLKTKLILGLLGLSLTACGGAAVNSASTGAAGNASPVANATTNANTTKINTVPTANSVANANVAKPLESGPKRIEFKKGEFSGSEDLTLKAGSVMRFVVGADDDQKIYIESSDESAKLKITTGKVTELSNEKGYFDGVTKGKGDVVFTVTNGGKTDMKTKLSVTLVQNGD